MQELIPTPYGEVRAEALEELQSSFDTRCLLSAADEFDRFCAHWKSELRDELFKVHCMAHTGINGAPMTRAPGKESLTETAYSLGEELREWHQSLQSAIAVLDQIAGMAPD